MHLEHVYEDSFCVKTSAILSYGMIFQCNTSSSRLASDNKYCPRLNLEVLDLHGYCGGVGQINPHYVFQFIN